MAGPFQTSPEAPRYRIRRPIGSRILTGVAAAAVIAGVWWAAHQESTATRKAAEDSVLIPVVPPPPPPPPPEQVKPEPKPEEVPPQPQPQAQPTPQPQAAPAQGQAVSINGPPQAGGDAFGIGSGSGGGMRGSGGIGNALGGFNRAGYVTYLQNALVRLLEADKQLRNAVVKCRARLWIDSAGKITRVEVTGTDKADAIRDALVGRTLRAPDPSIPMPLAMSLEGSRPG